MECKEFPKKLTMVEKAAWKSFVAVVLGFLGNHKAENDVELVESLVKNYGTMGCRMSLKSISLTLILINSRITWEHTRRSKASASTRIYWTLNAATKGSISRTGCEIEGGPCFWIVRG